MGLIYLEKEEERIYEAYEMIVYGTQDRYTYSKADGIKSEVG